VITYKVGQPITLYHKKPSLTKGLFEPVVISAVRYGNQPHKPKITIQITAYNEGQDLLSCIDSIVNQKYKNFEIVLVDNGLDKQTKEALKNYDLLHVIANENLGCTHGRNVGAVHASGELIAFIDADGYIKDDYLAKAVSIMDDPSITAVRGKVLPNEKTSSVPGHYNLGNKVVPSVISTEGNSVWRLADYQKVGGFEDSLAGGEGLVLCYRMHVIYGYDKHTFVYNPSLVLYHDFHSNKRHLSNKLYNQSIIRDGLQKKYPLITSFESYYNSQGAKPRQIADSTIGDTAERMRAKVKKEYLSIYDEKRQERRENPSLIKGEHDYLFTVIIPCYNLGSLLKNAVDSVLRQSIGNLQLIVVDDLSTDKETKDVLKSLEKHVEVIYLKKNGGVANARNHGIAKAKAEYILCLDADDTIEPTYLEKALNTFLLYPKAGIVTTWAQYFGEVNSQWRVREGLTLADALVASPVPTASCFRKEAWEQAGGYESKMRGYEDWELWISIMENGWKIEVITEINFNYYVRKDGKVNTSNKNLDNLVGIIYQNHKASYQENLEYVLSEKHRQIIKLRNQVRNLKGQTLKHALLNTPLGPVLKFAKKVLKKLGHVFSTFRRSPVDGGRLFWHYIKVVLYKTRRSLKRF